MPYNAASAGTYIPGVASSGGAGGLDAAGNALEGFTRQQWSDYANTYLPVQNMISGFATSNAPIQQAEQDAESNVAGAYSQAAGAQQRQLAGMGVTQTPAQKAAASREMGLSQGLSTVNAVNTARAQTYGLQQEAMD